MPVRDAAVISATTFMQVWAYPLLFAQRVRLNFTQPLNPTTSRPPTSAGAPVNTVGHQRALSDPRLAVGVAPNVDTLYSVAWLDVRHHDVVLELPDVGTRYASFQIALPDTTTAITVGAGASGGPLPTVRVSSGPPCIESTADAVHVRTRWRYVMVVGRILVEPESPDDLATAHRLQDAIELVCEPVAPAPAAVADRQLARLGRVEETTDPAAFALALQQVLDDADSAVVDDAVRRALTESLLATHAGSTGVRAAQTEGLARGLTAIGDHVRAFGRQVNGWAVNDVGTEFGADHLLRAAVAHSQIFINPASEALYPVCEVDADGNPLDGGRTRYRLTFPADSLPPVHAFWSLTAYHAEGLLVANEIDRYAIGDRTPGLSFAEDGSLTIAVQADRPNTTANWLPVPAGRFRLMLRLYRPARSTWSPPPVLAVHPGSPSWIGSSSSNGLAGSAS